ncbi:MAG: prenyltransferase [Halobacteriales archaeon]|nr:prenyltransferase [Halobacteriales archaeon]
MSEPDRRTVLVALWQMSRPAQLALIALVYASRRRDGARPRRDGRPRGCGYRSGRARPDRRERPLRERVRRDAETDTLTERTPFSGGSGALAETGLPRRLALRAAVASAVIGLLLARGRVQSHSPGGRCRRSPPPCFGGVLLVGWQYSLGPLRLAWRGLGEVTNAALGGIALPLYGFAVVADRVTVAAALATVPFALVVFVNLLETQWPDRWADAAVGKQTLATRWSPRRLRAMYGLASLVAAGSAVALAGRVLPSVVAVGTLVPMVGLVPGYRRFTRREEPLPAVATMVVTAATTTVAWGAVAAGLAG